MGQRIPLCDVHKGLPAAFATRAAADSVTARAASLIDMGVPATASHNTAAAALTATALAAATLTGAAARDPTETVPTRATAAT